MANLLDNKLFLQYLAAAGQDIASGNPIGTNVNLVTTQNIAAQNYANLLKKLLAGSGSVNVSDTKTGTSAPNQQQQQQSQTQQSELSQVNTGMSMLPFLLAGLG